MSYFSRDFHFQQIPAKKYHIVSSVNDSVLTNRFGTRSNNMFFVRHAANPKNLKFLTGIDGSMICSVKEDNYTLPDDMKKHLKNTLNESPAYDKFFFPKMLNENVPEKEQKRNQAMQNLGRKIGLPNSEVKSDIDKLSMLNKFVNNESGRRLSQGFERKNSNRSRKRSQERLKNAEKLESNSVFWMGPSKFDENELQSKSLILPKLKTIRPNNSNEKSKLDKIVIKDLKIRNIDSLPEKTSSTSPTSFKISFQKNDKI